MNLEVASKSDLKSNPYLQLSIILLIGFLLRIYLSTVITFENDFKTWQWWGEGLSKVGFSKFYSNYWCDYMPGYLYILRLLTDIQNELPGSCSAIDANKIGPLRIPAKALTEARSRLEGASEA